MSRPTADNFEPFVGQVFRVEGVDQALTLARIERSRHDGPFGRPFLLIFAGPSAPVLTEGLYRFAADGAAFELNVAPIHTPAGGGQDYQVVFN